MYITGGIRRNFQGMSLRPRGSSSSGSGIKRLMNYKTEGKGITQEVREKPISHPFKTLASSNMQGLESIKVKQPRTKKYISLNL